MFKKTSKKNNESLDDYILVNQKTHSITKKPSDIVYFITEISVYCLISLSSYFAIYLGTNKFQNKKEIENNVDLLTKYFSIENLENSLFGIFIVIGIISSLNYIITNSKFSLQHILNRLTHSFIDFIFLMLSSMLGLFFAVLEYTSILPNTSGTMELVKTLKVGIALLIICLFSYTFMLLMIKVNSEKINNY
ncbi:MAG: hypothetical protein RSD40_03310 [Bacilli bacterium]